MTTPPDVLRALLLDAVARNGSGLVRREMLPLAFPGSEYELALFCAVHALEATEVPEGWLLVSQALPDAVVESNP